MAWDSAAWFIRSCRALMARASGFCYVNDAAVVIRRLAGAGRRVAYVDIDAHHGDGVQEAFYGSAEVMTISVHESGLDLYPGTGFPGELGYSEGAGYAVNVPLPPSATDECFHIAFEGVVEPLARSFAPGLIVAQLGVDAHHADPQADLALTLPGYRSLVRGIVGLADELCDGRLAALGGGGYSIGDAVPRAWTWVMAELLDAEVPEKLPAEWRERVRDLLGIEAPTTLGVDDRDGVPADVRAQVLDTTEQTVCEVREAVFPYHGLTP